MATPYLNVTNKQQQKKNKKNKRLVFKYCKAGKNPKQAALDNPKKRIGQAYL